MGQSVWTAASFGRSPSRCLGTHTAHAGAPLQSPERREIQDIAAGCGSEARKAPPFSEVGEGRPGWMITPRAFRVKLRWLVSYILPSSPAKSEGTWGEEAAR